MKKNAFFICGLEIEREFGVPEKVRFIRVPSKDGILVFERGARKNGGMTRRWNCINVEVDDSGIR